MIRCAFCKHIKRDYVAGKNKTMLRTVLVCGKGKQLPADCELYEYDDSYDHNGRRGDGIIYGLFRRTVFEDGKESYCQISNFQLLNWSLSQEELNQTERIFVRECKMTKGKVWAMGKLYFKTREEAEQELRRLRGQDVL